MAAVTVDRLADSDGRKYWIFITIFNCIYIFIQFKRAFIAGAAFCGKRPISAKVKVWRVAGIKGRSIFKREDSARLLGEEMRPCTLFHGRLMNLDGREHPCHTIGMSPHFIAVRSSYPATISERIVIYLEGWDRFAGNVARLLPGGLAIEFEATHRRRAKIVAVLDWFSQEPSRIDLALRQDERITPRHRSSKIAFHGRIYECEIENVSRKGAALKTQAKLPVGARLELGAGRKAEVVRAVDDQLAVQFLRLLPLEIFDENIRL